MRRGVPHGYTIVETMIFLAITGLLFAMIAVTFAGRRGRTTFQASARDFESNIQGIVNDTTNGYFAPTGNFSCSASAAGPSFSGASSGQGSHEDCIFIGKALHFNVDGNQDRYNVYTVAGLRQVSPGGDEVTDFAEAKPTVVDVGGVNKQLQVPGGSQVKSVFYNSGSNIQIDGFGVFSSFGSYASGALESGSISVNIFPLGDPGPSSAAAMASSVYNLRFGLTHPQNPGSGITICFDSTTSRQHGILKIGGSGRQFGTDLTIAENLSAGDSRC